MADEYNASRLFLGNLAQMPETAGAQLKRCIHVVQHPAEATD